MTKIQMKTPLVEMDGDEMTRVLWADIKDMLIKPYVELKTEYYDLGLPNRDATGDQVTIDSANAAMKYGVAVKCATITPNAQRVEEYHLHANVEEPQRHHPRHDGRHRVPRTRSWSRACPPPCARGKNPSLSPAMPMATCIVIPKCAFPAPARPSWSSPTQDGQETRQTIFDFKGPGVVQGIHNLDGSIAAFAHSCFQYALDVKQDLWFSTKDTISKTYDHRFKDIFQEIYDREYKERFEAAGITYFYTLIDDAVARVVRSKGGFIWACKNYDGDVMSDMVATAFGSLAMMTSVLVSPDGKYEYEAAHGTVTRHYYRYLKGEETSTNPVATIFAWTRRTAQARRAGSAARPDGLCRPSGKGYPRHHQRRHHDQGPCPALRGRGSCRQQQGVSTGNSGTDVKKHVFSA